MKNVFSMHQEAVVSQLLADLQINLSPESRNQIFCAATAICHQVDERPNNTERMSVYLNAVEENGNRRIDGALNIEKLLPVKSAAIEGIGRTFGSGNKKSSFVGTVAEIIMSIHQPINATSKEERDVARALVICSAFLAATLTMDRTMPEDDLRDAALGKGNKWGKLLEYTEFMNRTFPIVKEREMVSLYVPKVY